MHFVKCYLTVNLIWVAKMVKKTLMQNKQLIFLKTSLNTKQISLKENQQPLLQINRH